MILSIESMLSKLRILHLTLLIVLVRFLFSVGLGNCSALAPDEKSYVDLFLTIFSNVKDFPSGYWSDGSIPFLKVAFFPARIFTTFGISALYSFRLLECMLFALTFYLLLKLLKLKLNDKIQLNHLVLTIFLFPSIIIWSSSGLRENFLYLEMIMIVLGLQKFFLEQPTFGLLMCTLGFIGMSQTKFYLAVLIFLAIIITVSLIGGRLGKKKRGMFLCGFLLLVLSLFVMRSPNLFVPKVMTSSQVKMDKVKPNPSYLAHVDSLNNSSVTSTQLQLCYKNNSAGFLLIPFRSLFATRSSIPEKELDKKSGSLASGVIYETGNSGASATDLMNIEQHGTFHNPAGILGYLRDFLLTPIPFTNSGSTAANSFELETIAWVVLYVTIGLALWRSRKQKWRVEELFCAVFSVCFILFSAETEVNVGTALRHRSLLLFPFAILLSLRWPADGLGVQTGLKKIFRK